MSHEDTRSSHRLAQYSHEPHLNRISINIVGIVSLHTNHHITIDLPSRINITDVRTQCTPNAQVLKPPRVEHQAMPYTHPQFPKKQKIKRIKEPLSALMLKNKNNNQAKKRKLAHKMLLELRITRRGEGLLKKGRVRRQPWVLGRCQPTMDFYLPSHR